MSLLDIAGRIIRNALGATAGAPGAALDITDSVCVELANFAVAEHCKTVGPTLRLKGIVDGTITVGPEEKTYRLVLQVEVYIDGVWILKIYVAIVVVPSIGLPSLTVFHAIEAD